MSAANQLPHLMTVAAFLDWETPDGSDCWELVDGMPEAIASAPPATALCELMWPVSSAIILPSTRTAVSSSRRACSRGQGKTITMSAFQIWRSQANRSRRRTGYYTRRC